MNVRYFAWLREKMGRDGETVPFPAEVETIGDAIAFLAARDAESAAAIGDPRLIRAALDAILADHDTPLGDAETLALFPPMTGG